MKALTKTEISGYPCRRGKVRDIYDLGDDKLIIVATDRISAFDVVMPNGIPNKGRVLTALTLFWLDILKQDAQPNHFISSDLKDLPEEFQRPELEGRVMLCKKAKKVFPVECVVRGYLAGSGWKEYQQTGRVCGMPLPPGLKQCDKLPAPIFTPATKAESGHDENITFNQMCVLIGYGVADYLRRWSISLYEEACLFASSRGIIIADTKFEFGLDGNKFMLIDEVLTPDSSRFWPDRTHKPGQDQESFDKQFVRNYLQGLCDQGSWDKKPPAPRLSEDIVLKTSEKYSALQKIIAKS